MLPDPGCPGPSGTLDGPGGCHDQFHCPRNYTDKCPPGFTVKKNGYCFAKHDTVLPPGMSVELFFGDKDEQAREAWSHKTGIFWPCENQKIVPGGNPVPDGALDVNGVVHTMMKPVARS